MRLRNLSEYYIMQRRVIRDELEGGRHEGFAPVAEAVPVMAHIYDKNSQITNTAGGIIREKVKLMLIDVPHKVTYDSETGQEAYEMEGLGISLQAGDGICVYTAPEQGPDFRVSAITDPGHLECRLERIG